MNAIMLLNDIVENVRGSFAMEDMCMSAEDEKRGINILTGKISIEDAIEEIKSKYVTIRKNV